VDGSLDLILHDATTGTSINLALLGVTDQSGAMAGLTVVRSERLILETQLQFWITDSGNGQPDMTEGELLIETQGEDEEAFSYRGHTSDVGGPYGLLETTVTSDATGVAYRTFALEDPFPLILLAPIAGVVAGGIWLWRRHKHGDATGIQTIQGAIKDAQLANKPVNVRHESISTITLPFGVRVEAKNILEVKTGEHPAA
jgi:hypothetical protein